MDDIISLKQHFSLSCTCIAEWALQTRDLYQKKIINQFSRLGIQCPALLYEKSKQLVVFNCDLIYNNKPRYEASIQIPHTTVMTLLCVLLRYH